MEKAGSYTDYVFNEPYFDRARAHQARYRDEPRESDKLLVGRVQAALAGASRPRILDLGCGFGNLLRLLRRSFPEADLTGLDLNQASLEACRADTALARVKIVEGNMLDVPPMDPFDVVITDASCMFFDATEQAAAFRQVSRLLKPGGSYVAFEYVHSFDQDVELVEFSRLHTAGLRYYYRGLPTTSRLLESAQLKLEEFSPFSMPFDIRPREDSTDINTYTVRAADGFRYSFRGCLAQPWAHVVARRL